MNIFSFTSLKTAVVRSLIIFGAALGAIVSTAIAAHAASIIVQEGSNATLNCTSNGGTLKILSAIYGKLGNSQLTCNATVFASNKCNGKTACSFAVNNSICGDPDPGVHKEMKIDYQCNASSSQNIHPPQVSITPIVATTSGQAITNAIDSGIDDAFSPSGTPTNFGPNGGFINFAAAPQSTTASRAEEAFAALAYGSNVTKAPVYKASPLLDRDWSAWGDIRGTGWKVNDTLGDGNDIKGNQLNLTVGLGRKLTPDTLVGVIAGYENFKYDVAALGASLKGSGETIGGYFAQRFATNIRFDAAIGWTDVNYNATDGTATGSFIGSRWLASSGLTGDYKLNVYMIEPSARVYILWERENAWTDSLGTLQASRNFSAGRTALGVKIGRPFEVSNGWTLMPYGGLYGDWRFQTDNALPTGTLVANIGTGWSGRVTSGLMAKAAGGSTVSLDGEYGGLGANYKIWTGNVRGTVPF
jgi:hypothetical protein